MLQERHFSLVVKRLSDRGTPGFLPHSQSAFLLPAVSQYEDDSLPVDRKSLVSPEVAEEANPRPACLNADVANSSGGKESILMM